MTGTLIPAPEMRTVRSKERSRFRRWAFRVCLLLLAVVVLLRVGVWWQQSNDLGSIVENAGGRYYRHNSNPLLQRTLLGITGRSSTSHSIRFSPGQVGDEWLRGNSERLKKLNNLQLVLRATHVTDAGIRELQNIPRLQRLDLRGTKLSDQSAAVLSKHNGLYILNVAHTGITDAGLQQICSTWHPCLGIDASQLTDAAQNA